VKVRLPRQWLAPALIGALWGVAAAPQVDDPPWVGSEERDRIRALFDAGQYEEARRAALDLLAAVDREGAPPLDVAAALDLAAEGHWQTGDASEAALERARRALRIREQAGAADAPEAVRAFTNLGILLELTGDYAGARPLHERALGPEHPDLALTLTNLGILTRTVGAYDEAQSYFERALAIREAALGPDDVRVAFTVYNLASVEWDRADYVGARRHFESAVALFERQLGEGDLRLADGVEALGVLLQATGDLHAARRHFERALSLRERVAGPDHALVAHSLLNLSSVLVEMGEPAAARDHVERALPIATAALGPGHEQVASLLFNLGRAQAAEGDADAALASQVRAIEVWTDALGEDHPQLARGLHARAELELARGRVETARVLLEQARRIREAGLGPEHPALAEVLVDLARIDAETGSFEAARERALRAHAIQREHLRLVVSALPERQALHLVAKAPWPAELAASLVAERPALSGAGATWDALQSSRALVLDEMAARQRLAAAAADPALAELARARARLANLVVRGPGDDAAAYRRDLERARATKEELEAQLAERGGERGRGAHSLADAIASLPPGSALLAFFLTRTGLAPPSYVAFAAGPGREPIAVPVGEAGAIDALVARWRERVGDEAQGRGSSRAEVLAARAGAALRRRIWDPLAEALVGAECVFVVPAGQLHLVSLAALPGRDGRYLVESGPVFHYLSAERDLLASPGAPGSGLLALGDPAFDGDAPERVAGAAPARRSACDDLSRLRFEPRPASGTEAESVAEIWAESRSEPALELRGAAASEGEFKRRAPGQRVLHLATHGFFLGADCAAPDAPRESPLLLAGLGLSGANQRGADAAEEDGILTAEEIAALDLGSVEWAVLSACETGLGEVLAGEGVFGLRRAFRLAGARTLIMSLWQVDDETTRRLMTDLYRLRFGDGLSTADAVHAASRAALQARRAEDRSAHPFYWASFVGAGDWR
jgi:CHAT domain-containing protein/tetratricopeptide (TPR) repeat protein